MNSQQVLLKIISTLAILVPIAAALWRFGFRTNRIITLFLIIGFISDTSMWYLYYHPSVDWMLGIYKFYSLIESVFFFWIIRETTESQPLRKVAMWGIRIAVPFWVLGFLIVPYFIEGRSSQSIPFDTSYEVASAFLAGFGLLSLAERSSNLTNLPAFWFNLAIFVYCFCTFFVDTFLGYQVVFSLWPVQNVANLISYALYTMAILTSPKTVRN